MKYTVFIFIILCIFYAGSVRANGFGAVLDKVVGDYTLNVDYDAVNGIVAGDPVQFAFQLFNKDRSAPQEFTDVWVSITPSGTNSSYTPPLFDGGLIQSNIFPATMTFIFPAGGTYDLKVRYDKNDKTLAEAAFPLTVSGSGNAGDIVNRRGIAFNKDFFAGAAGVLLIEACAWLVLKFFKKR